jgi:hypothetical protein
MRRLSSLSWITSLAVILGLGLMVLGPVHSQPRTDDISTLPGYVDFSGVDSWFDAPASTEVDIRGPLVDLVAEASASSDPDFSDLMGDVKAIQVRGFPLSEEEATDIQTQTDQLAASLEDTGWTRVIYVRDNAEQVSIYLREAGDKIAGLTLLSTKPGDEAVYVNIVGSLSPDQIANLGRGLNLSSLEQVDVSKNTPE